MLAHLTAAHRQAISQALEVAWATPGPLHLDFAATESIDTVGAALLTDLAKRAERAKRPVGCAGLRPELQAFLASIPYGDGQAKAQSDPPLGLLEQVGIWLERAAAAVVGAALLISELAYFAFDAACHRPRRVRGLESRAVLVAMEVIGAGAVPVVALIAFLVGLTIALQSAAQLAPYGATVFVVDLIGLSVCRELGPLIAAIVVAGRSGAACAAQVATMVVTEEVSALEAMGIEPAAYTVLPALLAILVTQPMVSLCAQAAAIFGAFVVGVGTLSLSPAVFFSRLAQAIEVRDLLFGAIKSSVFGLLIVVVSARSGYAVTGGAEGVGHSTTRSVVMAIFCIVVADAAFSFVFYA